MVLIISLYSFTLHNFSMRSLPHSDLGRRFVTKSIYRIYESKDKIKDRASPFIELESRVEYATRIQKYGVGLGEAEQLNEIKLVWRR